MQSDIYIRESKLTAFICLQKLTFCILSISVCICSALYNCEQNIFL